MGKQDLKSSIFIVKSPIWLSLWRVWPLTLKSTPQKWPKHNPLTDKTLLNNQLQNSGTNTTSTDTFTTPSALRYLWSFPLRKNKYSTPSIWGLFWRYPLQFIKWTLVWGWWGVILKQNENKLHKKESNVIMLEVFLQCSFESVSSVAASQQGTDTNPVVEGFHCLWRAQWSVGF